MKSYRIVAAVLLAFLTTLPATYAFEEQPFTNSPRSLGMGGTRITNGWGYSTLSSNPALLSLARYTEVGIVPSELSAKSLEDGPQGTSDHVSLLHVANAGLLVTSPQLRHQLTFALSYTYESNISTAGVYDDQGDERGGPFWIDFGFGRELFSGLAIGGAVHFRGGSDRYTGESAEYSSGGPSYGGVFTQWGVLLRLGEWSPKLPITLGAIFRPSWQATAVQNGNSVSIVNPAEWGVGASWQPVKNLTFASDWAWIDPSQFRRKDTKGNVVDFFQDNRFIFAIHNGLEYRHSVEKVVLSLRAGYSTVPVLAGDGGIIWPDRSWINHPTYGHGPSLGLGLDFGGARLDAGWFMMSTHHTSYISLGSLGDLIGIPPVQENATIDTQVLKFELTVPLRRKL